MLIKQTYSSLSRLSEFKSRSKSEYLSNKSNGNNQARSQSVIERLHKGKKIRIDQKSYSKLKFFHRPRTNTLNALKYSAMPLTLASNNDKIANQKTQKSRIRMKTYKQLMDQTKLLKQIEELSILNQNLSEQNMQLQRKIKKQSKISQLFKKKVHNNDFESLTYHKLLEIKLLLQIEFYQDHYEYKQKQYLRLLKQKQNKKNSKQFIEDSIYKKADLYALIIQNQDELLKLKKDTQRIRNEQKKKLQRLQQNKQRHRYQKGQKTSELATLNKELVDLKERVHLKQIQMYNQNQTRHSERQNAASPQMSFNLINSSLHIPINNNNKSSHNGRKQKLPAWIRDRSNYGQLQQKICHIRQQIEQTKNQIQSLMDDMIAKKLTIFKQIYEYDDKFKIQKLLEDVFSAITDIPRLSKKCSTAMMKAGQSKAVTKKYLQIKRMKKDNANKIISQEHSPQIYQNIRQSLIIPVQDNISIILNNIQKYMELSTDEKIFNLVDEKESLDEI